MANHPKTYEELLKELEDLKLENESLKAQYKKDIAESKQVEETLNYEQYLMHALMNNIPDHIYFKDCESRFIRINNAMAQSFGLSDPGQVVGKTDYDFFTYEHAQQAYEDEQEIIRTRQPIIKEEKETWTDRPDTWVSTSKMPLYDKDEKIIGTFGVSVNITEHKQAEEALQRSELRFRTLYENAKIGLYRTNPAGNILMANKAVVKILGYPSFEKIVERNLEKDSCESTYQHKEFLEKIEKDGEINDFESVWVRQDGSEFFVRESAQAIRDSQGTTLYYDGVVEDITERKGAEEEVRESEERFRMVFENVFDGISIYNEDPDPSKRRLIECNERYSILAGRSRDELLQLGSTLGLQMTLEDKANINRLESIDRGTAYQGFFSWIRPDGKENVIEYVGMPITWRGKSYSIGIDRDITERKRAEEALRESQSLYHSFIEQLPNPVFRKDREGRYVLVNSQFCRLKGLKKEDFIGRKPMEVEINELEKQGGQGQATKYANVGEDIHELIMRTGKLIEKEEEYPGTNGGKQFMQVVRMPVFDFYGTVIGTQGIMFDISERKRAEEEIVILVQSLRSVNECVSITDMKDKLIFVNQSFLNAYGYSEDELIGKQISMVRSPNNPPELIAEILSAALHGGWKGELRNKRKDGSEFLIYLSTTIINDKDGKPIGLIGVATDITERKRTEQELIEAKEKAESANKLKDAFIANISHEIRTPLNGILGISSIIRDTFHDQMKEEDEVLFEGIDFSSKRIIRTIDMILNYSSLQVGEFQIKRKDMELSPICENLVKEFTVPAKFKSLKLIYESKYENAIIFADEYTVILAISNLIDNAIKYTIKGFINVILRKGNNDDIILDVKDTGIGINEKYLENMFEPYRQEQMGYERAYEGLGLGLSLVKQVLALNNAKVFVESKKGDR